VIHEETESHYLQAVYEHVNTCPYFTLLSMEIKDLDWAIPDLKWLFKRNTFSLSAMSMEGFLLACRRGCFLGGLWSN